MTDENIKSIRYTVSADTKLNTIALKLGRTKRQLFIQMVDYFHKSKKDPADINDELLKNTLLKNHKEYIGFIKTQETELLIPAKLDMVRMIDSQKKLLDCFNNQVLRHNESLLKNQQEQSSKFSETDQLMRSILGRLNTKDQLKKNFMYILDSYIKVRESFGFRTSAKEKEELIYHSREQVKNL
jgi:hypothetical protein